MAKNKEKIGFIYLFTNLINDDKYVGQTRAVKVEHRWNIHRKSGVKGAKMYIHRAICSYGWETFKREVVWTGPVELLNNKETYYIKKHNSFIDDGHGYNLTRGGGVNSKSKIVIRKHRKAARRRWSDPEERALQAERKKLNWLDPEYRVNVTACQIGKKLTKSTCKKISKARKGITATDEARAAMSAAHLARYAADPTLRFRVGAGNRGNHAPKSEAAKASMREGAARRWSRSEEHTRASLIQRGRQGKPHSLDSRAERSAKTKLLWQDPAYRAAHAEVGKAVAESNRRRGQKRKLSA